MRYRYLNRLNLLLFLYFCLPKIDLFTIPGIPTGIRAQDLLVAFILSSARVHIPLGKFFKNKSIFYFLIIILIINGVGAVLSNSITSYILGWMRLLEYLIVGYALYTRLLSSFNLLKVIIAFQIFSSICQYLFILPVLDPGRGTLFTVEYAGSFGTAAELSYFCFIAVFLLLNSKHNTFSILTLVLPLLSGVRAYLTVIPLYFYVRYNFKLFTLLFPIFFLSAWFFVAEYFEFLVAFFNNVVLYVDQAQVSLSGLKDRATFNSGDLALDHRIGKWATAVALIFKSHAGLIGSGLYSAGGALDGGLLRLALEFGLPAFFVINYIVIRMDFGLFLIFCAVNLLFDAYMSSVVMPIFIAFMLTKQKRHSIA
jgi:hypothetical protein